MFSLSVNEIFKAIEASDHHLLREALVTINLETLLSFKNAEVQPLLHYAVIQQNYPVFKLMIDQIESSQEPGLKEKALLSTDDQGNSLFAYINVAEQSNQFLYTFNNLLKNRAGHHPLLGLSAADKRQVSELQRDIEVGDLGQVKRYSDNGSSFKVRYPAIPGVTAGNTPLHSAVQVNQLAIVQHIIACDPELLSWANFSGQTALQLARQHLDRPGTEDRTTQQAIVNYLSTQERELSDPEMLKQQTHQQLFRTIASGGTTDLFYFLEQLTDLTPLLEIKNAQGQSLLHCAINARNQKAIQLIFKKAAQYEESKKILAITDDQGNSLLHYAVTTQDSLLICDLVYAGIDLSLKNSDQLTAVQQYQSYQPNTYTSLENLPREIEIGNFLFIKEYVAQGFPLQVRYRDGNNPLHLAVQRNQPEIVQYLVDNAPQLLTTKNFNSQTPKELALASLEEQQETINTLNKTLLQCDRNVTSGLSNKLDELSKVRLYKKNALELSRCAKERLDIIVQALSTSVENRENQIHPVVKPEVLAPEFPNLNHVRKVASLFEIFKISSPASYADQQLFINKLRPCLPTVWSIAQNYCYLALHVLRTQSASPENKQLLESLFGSNYDLTALERQIKQVAYYLQRVKNRNEILKSIELWPRSHEVTVHGWVDSNKIEFNGIRKINLVPYGHHNLTEFLHTLIHEVSHLANDSVDFAYSVFCEKEPADENQKITVHRVYNNLVQLVDTGDCKTPKFTQGDYRIFEIALINKLLSNQCTAKEVEEILSDIKKILESIYLEKQLINKNAKLMCQEDSLYDSIATVYGTLDEHNATMKSSQIHNLQEGKNLTASPQQVLENFFDIDVCQRKKVAALHAQAKRVKSTLAMHNADSIAASIAILATGQECSTASIVSYIEWMKTGFLNQAEWVKVKENRLPDGLASPRLGGEKGAPFETAITEGSSPDNPDSDANINNLKQDIVMIDSHLTGREASTKPLLISGESSTIVNPLSALSQGDGHID